MSWRAAGITFLKYSQLCAEHVREALKEPMKAKKIASEGLHVRIMKYEGGKRVKTGARAQPSRLGHHAPFAAAAWRCGVLRRGRARARCARARPHCRDHRGRSHRRRDCGGQQVKGHSHLDVGLTRKPGARSRLLLHIAAWALEHIAPVVLMHFTECDQFASRSCRRSYRSLARLTSLSAQMLHRQKSLE